MYLVEYLNRERKLYKLDAAKIAVIAAVGGLAFLQDYAANLCNDIIDRIRWQLSKAADYAVPDDYDGAVSIIVKCYFDDRQPVNYLANDRGDKITVFNSVADAEAWIVTRNDIFHSLLANARGLPTYTTVPAYRP